MCPVSLKRSLLHGRGDGYRTWLVHWARKASLGYGSTWRVQPAAASRPGVSQEHGAPYTAGLGLERTQSGSPKPGEPARRGILTVRRIAVTFEILQLFVVRRRVVA